MQVKRPTNLTCLPPQNGCSTPYGSPWHEYLVQSEARRACNVPIDDITKKCTSQSESLDGSNNGRGRLSCHGRGHTLGPTPEPQISESMLVLVSSSSRSCLHLKLKSKFFREIWDNTANVQCRSLHKSMTCRFSRTVRLQRPVQRPPGSTLSMYCPPAYTYILSHHKRIKIRSSWEFALFPQAFD
ncbi:hypothetical protein BDN71DRAFT_1451348 [Pleurotus eryngii]|uniref:Uncharacterized protein n=1 Tax=Pleurotus eryngii TaxID=5323 RepID=A0A9P5ZQB2_PLEER|nr:hypothetical protein BDN71DRAFT_1451348 [Pleurotus eryngii]